MSCQHECRTAREYVSDPSGAEKLYLIPLSAPLEPNVRDIRLWALIEHKRAPCRVKVYVRHCPDVTSRDFVAHSTSSAERSFNSTDQILVGTTDVASNEPLGLQLEILIGIRDNGAFVAARVALRNDAALAG